MAGQRAVTEQVYDGSYPYHPYRPFNETVGEDRVSLDTFKYVASLVSCREAVEPAKAAPPHLPHLRRCFQAASELKGACVVVRAGRAQPVATAAPRWKGS